MEGKAKDARPTPGAAPKARAALRPGLTLAAVAVLGRVLLA